MSRTPDHPPHPSAEETRRYFASIQDENGVDLTLIRDNLQRTPAERLRRAENGRADVLWLRKHARRIDAKPADPA